MAIVMDNNFKGTIGAAFSGDALYSVVTGSPIYSATSHPAVQGVRCPAAAQTVISYPVSGTPTVRTESRICKVSGTVTATAEIIQFRPASGRGIGLQILSTGKIRIVDTASTAVATGTVNVPMDGTEFRVELTINGTACTAKFWANITDTTAADTISGTAAASVSVVTVRDGLQTAGGLGAGITYDVIWPQATDNTTSPGPRSYIFTYNVNIDDTVTISDTGSPQETAFTVVMDDDPVGIADSLDTSMLIVRTIADGVGIVDSVVDSISTNLNDNVGLTDLLNLSVNNTSAQDSAGIVDDLSFIWSLQRGLDDQVALTDTLSVEKIVNINLSDSIGATDSNIPTLGGNFAIVDPVGISDVLDIQRTILLTIAENISIRDTLVWPGTIGAADGSIADIETARLRDLGYVGTLPDMRAAWLKDQIVDPSENYYSLRDLEFAYLRSLGYTGSLADMRAAAQVTYKD